MTLEKGLSHCKQGWGHLLCLQGSSLLIQEKVTWLQGCLQNFQCCATGFTRLIGKAKGSELKVKLSPNPVYVKIGEIQV